MLYSFCAKENNLKGPFSRLKNGKCAARVIVAQYAQKQQQQRHQCFVGPLPKLRSARKVVLCTLICWKKFFLAFGKPSTLKMNRKR